MTPPARAAVRCRCRGETFHVRYDAPVYAVVEDGEVVRVVVADESLAGPGDVDCAGCQEALPAAAAAAVRATADGPWPGWEFGW
jgi:hypothetical protein